MLVFNILAQYFLKLDVLLIFLTHLSFGWLSLSISLLFVSVDYFLHYALRSPSTLHIASLFHCVSLFEQAAGWSQVMLMLRKDFPFSCQRFAVHILGFLCPIHCLRLHGFNHTDLISKSMFSFFSSFLFLLTSTLSLCSWYLKQKDCLVSHLSINHDPCLYVLQAELS